MAEQISGGVTAAQGFQAASTAAGIKYRDRTDMAMVYSTAPCICAGTFTSNVVKAAPVVWDRNVVRNSAHAQAVVINAGIANACTGPEGMKYCEETAEAAAAQLGISPDAVLLASTGVIGKQLPIDRIKAGVGAMAPNLSGTIEAGTAASRAIMTTDTQNKEIAVTFQAGGKTVTLGGMSKGSGMIHPNMCTMLCFLTTDLAISKELLQEALSEDVRDTFNMISVDGDTSTNDTVLLLANGLAGNAEITEKGEDYDAFVEALRTVNEYLAKRMAADGEGATKLLAVKVVNAQDKAQAVTLSKAVVTSSLVKTAVYGNDANWGRILCAMGYSGEQFDPDRVDLYIESEADGRLQLVADGAGTDFSEELATRILSAKEVTAIADIKAGDACATAWGCDLTYDYVKINADYRS
ncbi:MAG: bifunctional glutamate N-acetyltransferase/amino-acid acetyltransferase ArgJ [Lachnospiraceae bacterium]|nr:bifunctional glutamate N-acetyltransferase/amino-acid acetyltransferase ArgJ [Lachnospiraceae bacterium]